MPKRMIYKEKEVPSRRLSNAVTKAFLADFKRHGKQAIERVREEKPDVYLTTIAKIMPKQLDVGIQHSFSDVLREAAQAIDSKRESQLIADYIEGESERVQTASFAKDTGGGPQGEGLPGSHAPARINISTHLYPTHLYPSLRDPAFRGYPRSDLENFEEQPGDECYET